MPSSALDPLTTPPPAVDPAVLDEGLRRHYGRVARLVPLPGERDANYLVETAEGWRAVLKLFNPAEPAPSRALGRAVLIHLEGRPLPFAVPRLIRTRAGDEGCRVETAAGPIDAMLVSFVPGEPWSTRLPGRGPRRALGEAAARLRLALAGFDHPAARRSLPWDPMGLGRLAPVAAALDDRRRGDWLGRFLERFEAEIRPAAAALAAGTLHNDLNASNVLLHPGEDRVSGIIDFGDLLHGPLLADLAIACSYDLDGPDPAAAVADFADGYAGVVPLVAAEMALLYDLVVARLVLRVLIYAWRAARDPGAVPYLTRHEAAAQAALDRVMARAPAPRAGPFRQ